MSPGPHTATWPATSQRHRGSWVSSGEAQGTLLAPTYTPRRGQGSTGYPLNSQLQNAQLCRRTYRGNGQTARSAGRQHRGSLEAGKCSLQSAVSPAFLQMPPAVLYRVPLFPSSPPSRTVSQAALLYGHVRLISPPGGTRRVQGLHLPPEVPCRCSQHPGRRANPGVKSTWL